MRAKKIVFPVLLLILLPLLFFACCTKAETSSVSLEYTGGELILFASNLNCDIENVTVFSDSSTEKEDTKLSCMETLLGYEGKGVFYFGQDHIITKINFIFPASSSWNDIANRISEQLGEASIAKLYSGGGAEAQWENSGYLFYLATDSKTMTLSVTNYYGGNN